MCGIVGYVGFRDAKGVLINGLRKLEYRGYDSAGIALYPNIVSKCVGDVSNLKVPKAKSHIGIAHTRWATHGGVSVRNAHPQKDCSGRIFVVHNGIIENYADLKRELIKKGHIFKSDTDTEVIPHFFEEELKHGTMLGVMKKFTKVVRGTYAIAMIVDDQGIYVLKKSSPLAIGIRKDEMFVGSDIYAFSDMTNKAIFLDDLEYGIVTKSGYKIFKNGRRVKKRPQTFRWESNVEKRKYAHYMLKEIHEEPEAMRRLLKSIKFEQSKSFDHLVRDIRKYKKVYFVAAGTSYHATLVATYILNKVGVDAHTMIASEFDNYMNVDKKTLVVAVSQSGETMDVINVIKNIPRKNVVSIVNVPYSTIQRMSSYSIETMAGQEVAVAATKSFTNQVLLFIELAKRLRFKYNVNPNDIERYIRKNERVIAGIAKKLYKKKNIYVLGRGISYPIAREIALKLKEVAYIHAEGMMGGELKHGTIALIEKGTPVIALMSDEKMASNVKEVEARGAYVVPVYLKEFVIEGALFGHLLSYYIAKMKHLPIDKPRNLAKSVTVV